MPAIEEKHGEAPAAEPKKNGNGKPAKNGKKPSDRAVIYPRPEVKLCIAGEPLTAEKQAAIAEIEALMRERGIEAVDLISRPPITVAMMKKVLGWETEQEYAQRMVREHPDLTEDALRYGEEYFLKDEHGEKVRCSNNDKNRPFDREWCLGKAQDILTRNWRFNGESMIVGRTGRAESLQHRGVALIFAAQMWEANRKKWPLWAEEPWIESVVVTGIDEDLKTTMTIDDVKPRSPADVVYTSEYFKGFGDDSRRRAARMMNAALALVWMRTGMRADSYMTNAAALGFIGAHPGLQRAVKHIIDHDTLENARGISKHRLSAGQCAGILYLQGCGASDGDDYRSRDPRTEKRLNWSLRDKAEEFWASLAAADSERGEDGEFKAPDKAGFSELAWALGKLADQDDGSEGSDIPLGRKRFALISKAWEVFSHQQRPIAAEDLELHYHTDEHGKQSFLDWSDFGGIDLGDKPKEDVNERLDPAAPSEGEIDQNTKGYLPGESDADRRKRLRKIEADRQAAVIEESRAKQADKDKATETARKATGGKPPAPAVLPKPKNKREETPAA